MLFEVLPDSNNLIYRFHGIKDKTNRSLEADKRVSDSDEYSKSFSPKIL